MKINILKTIKNFILFVFGFYILGFYISFNPNPFMWDIFANRENKPDYIMIRMVLLLLLTIAFILSGDKKKCEDHEWYEERKGYFNNQ